MFNGFALSLKPYSIGLESNPVKDLTPSSEGNTAITGGAPCPSVKKFHGYGTKVLIFI